MLSTPKFQGQGQVLGTSEAKAIGREAKPFKHTARAEMNITQYIWQPWQDR